MTSFLEYLAFIIFAGTVYSLARWFRYVTSGVNYSELKALASFILNLCFVFFYRHFLVTDEIIFYGSVESPSLKWLSIPMMYAHAFCFSVPWEPARWFLRRKFDPRIREYK